MIAARIASNSLLDECQRLFDGLESTKLGHGGDGVLAAAAGQAIWHPGTVSRLVDAAGHQKLVK